MNEVLIKRTEVENFSKEVDVVSSYIEVTLDYRKDGRHGRGYYLTALPMYQKPGYANNYALTCWSTEFRGMTHFIESAKRFSKKRLTELSSSEYVADIVQNMTDFVIEDNCLIKK